jgi:alpha-tubulin suppressor-like RCC1 family protein
MLASLSVLLTLLSVFTVSTTASSTSSTPEISVGDKFMIVQTATGEIWGWGDNANGVLGNALFERTGTNVTNPTKISLPNAVKSTAISAGADHVLALGSDGNVYAWGNNAYGQLGFENGGTMQSTPTLVEALQNKNVIAVSAGRFFSLALTEGGQVYSFGTNHLLQLGYAFAENDPSTMSATPTLIAGLSTVFITQISAGYDSAIAIDVNGKAHLWGSTKNCILGTDDANPVAQLPLVLPDTKTTTPIDAVALSENHSTFLLNNGQIGFMGVNKYGQYGNGATSTSKSKKFNTETDISALNIIDLAVSEQQTVLLSADGKVYTAGARLSGDTESATKTFVSLFEGSAKAPVASAIGAGYQNGALIAQDGSVWTWGDNSRGQLGNGTVDNSTATPQKVLQANGSAFGAGNQPFVKDVPMLFKATVPAPTYAIAIPSSINVGELRQADVDSPDRYAVKEGFTIEAINVSNLFGEKEIVLSVEAGEGDRFYLHDGNGTTLPFEILTSQTVTTSIQNGGVLARFTQDDSVQTWIRVDQSLITKSGVYNGVLTFRYSVVDLGN